MATPRNLLLATSLLHATVAAAAVQPSASRRVKVSVHGVYSQIASPNRTIPGYGVRPNINFFLSEKWALDAGYYSQFDGTSSQQLLTGFDGGLRFHFLGGGPVEEYTSPNVSVTSYSDFSPYALVSLRSRTVHGAVDVSYSGLGLGAGVIVRVCKLTSAFCSSDGFFMVGEVSIDTLRSHQNPSLVSTNVSLGLGRDL